MIAASALPSVSLRPCPFFLRRHTSTTTAFSREVHLVLKPPLSHGMPCTSSSRKYSFKPAPPSRPASLRESDRCKGFLSWHLNGHHLTLPESQEKQKSFRVVDSEMIADPTKNGVDSCWSHTQTFGGHSKPGTGSGLGPPPPPPPPLPPCQGPSTWLLCHVACEFQNRRFFFRDSLQKTQKLPNQPAVSVPCHASFVLVLCQLTWHKKSELL